MQELDPDRTTWHITFGTYGTRLHGAIRPTLDRTPDAIGTPFLPPDSRREAREHQRRRFPPVRLTLEQRCFLQRQLPRICARGGWNLRIAAAETDHVQALVDILPEIHGEKARHLMKRWLSEALSEVWPLPEGATWWAEEGSNIAIRENDYLNNAYAYIERQRASEEDPGTALGAAGGGECRPESSGAEGQGEGRRGSRPGSETTRLAGGSETTRLAAGVGDDPARSPAEGGLLSPWVRLRSATYHPLIFQRMVGEVDRAARPGDVVNVYDKTGALFGRGLFNGRSQIVLRMLTHGDAPIDEAFWRARLGQAVALRRQLGIEQATDAYRLVHAEGDELSGLIVERYADVLVFELFSLGTFARRREIAAYLADLLGSPSSLDRPQSPGGGWRTVIRADERIARTEGFTVPAEERGAVGDVVVREHGIRYRVDLAAGHKTGFFCDQRENRRKFAGYCREVAVLDLCCYTGGFGLAARLLGGAAEVTSVDLDEAAVAVARDNANLNQTRINIVHGDAFTYIRQMLGNERRFDAVVLDPPKLALTRRDIDDALKKYHDLNHLAMQTVRPGGVYLTCSCSGLVSRESFTQTVHLAARRARRRLQLFDRTGAAPDHPVLLGCPESEYLKALWFRVLG